jgi:hypothetical protein
MKYPLFGLFVLVTIMLGGCYYEVAKPTKKQYLIVASDFLTYKDMGLFDGFEKKTRIQVVLKPMSSSEMYQLLKKEGTDTRVDLCLLSSSYSAYVLEKNRLLQTCPESLTKSLPSIQVPLISRKRTAFGIGIDPYVLLCSKDTLSINGYADLQKSTSWESDLTEKKDWYPFCVSALSLFRKEKNAMAVRWLDRILSNKIKASEHDTLHTQQVFLSRYSHVYGKKKKPGETIVFPNQRTSGTFYDIPVAAIVYQARNYNNAWLLIHHLSQKGMNQLLCKRKGYLSIHQLGEEGITADEIGPIRIFRHSLQYLFERFDDVRSTLRSVSEYQRKKRLKKPSKKPVISTDSTQVTAPVTQVEQ